MIDWRSLPNEEEAEEQEPKKKVKDYHIDSTPLGYAYEGKKSDDDIRQLFTKERKRQLYIYPVNSLIKNAITNELSFSEFTIKIGFIDSNEVKSAIAYEISDFSIELGARNSVNPQDSSTLYTSINSKVLVFQELNIINKAGVYVVAIGNAANKDNIDNLYIIDYYNQPFENEAIRTTKYTTITHIKDFKTRDGHPIIIKIQKQLPADTKLKALTITFPRATLFGNIKLIGEVDGIVGYPKLYIEEDKVMLPIFAMPIEIDPKVRILNQWMSTQVLAWQKSKIFIHEGSVLDIIKFGTGTEKRKLVILNAKISNAKVKIGATYQSVGMPKPPPWPRGYNTFTIREIKADEWFRAETNLIKNCRPDGQEEFRGSRHTWLGSTEFDRIELEIKDAPLIDSLQKVLLEMLNYTYNYRTNFKHAKYYNKEEDPNESERWGLPKNEAANLKELFAGQQRPEMLITHLFEDWRFENPNYIHHPSIKIFKQTIMMLSEYFFTELAINTGLNDDYKLLLPYYFELLSKPFLKDGKYIFKDIRVKLKSEYFNFNNKEISVKNQDISENQLFELSDNQYNWLPLTNQLEANIIPSLLPKDIKLSDGNYGKNFVNFIVQKENLSLTMNIYGKGIKKLLNNFSWIQEIIKTDNTTKCKFILEDNLEKFKRIELSSIFGQGKYDFELETDKGIVNINDINLFNERITSYIKLEF